MYSPKQFGRKSDEFGGLATVTMGQPRLYSTRCAVKTWENEGGSGEALGDHDLERSGHISSVSQSAPSIDEQSSTRPNKGAVGGTGDLARKEDKILRSLGTAVIMRWNTIPTKLQRELFDDASSLEDSMQPVELRGQIARFLHNRKDD